jgi:hypothetical protein
MFCLFAIELAKQQAIRRKQVSPNEKPFRFVFFFNLILIEKFRFAFI